MATEGITPYGRRLTLLNFFATATHAIIEVEITYSASNGGGTLVQKQVTPIATTFVVSADTSTLDAAAYLGLPKPVFPIAYNIGVPRPSDAVVEIESVEVQKVILTNALGTTEYYDAALSVPITFTADGELTITSFDIDMSVISTTLL